MNALIKTLIITWLLFCMVVIWLGCAAAGFVLAFSEFSFMYDVTPTIGLTGSICIIYSIVRVVKSNPKEFLFKSSI